MPKPRAIAKPAPHVSALISALRDPSHTRGQANSDWDQLLRTARNARLLPTLAQRFAQCGEHTHAPLPAQEQFSGALALSRYLTQMMRVTLTRATDTLTAHGIDIVLLKGAAYISQNAPIASARLPNDVDILVGPNDLAAAEEALKAAQWQSEATLTDYDQHYYRAWSHELPPLRYPGDVLELDVHHRILPPTSRVSPPTPKLLARAVPIPGTPWRALAAEDQLLHIAAHVFIDSDCTSRLRDLYDFNELLAHFLAREPSAAMGLTERSQALGLLPTLSYMLQFIIAWLARPNDAHFDALIALHTECQNSFQPKSLVLRLASHTLGPIHPDNGPSRKARLAQPLLAARYALLRMPLRLLAFHSASKLLRRLKHK